MKLQLQRNLPPACSAVSSRLSIQTSWKETKMGPELQIITQNSINIAKTCCTKKAASLGSEINIVRPENAQAEI
jgi:hypothetical protein